MTTDHAALVRELLEYAQTWKLDYNIKVALERAASALQATASAQEGWQLVPKEPNEMQWGGLARDLIMWSRFQKHAGCDLYGHLRSLGRVIPNWLLKEIPDTSQVPPKGTVAACIYKAMLAAAPNAPTTPTAIWKAGDERKLPCSSYHSSKFNGICQNCGWAVGAHRITTEPMDTNGFPTSAPDRNAVIGLTLENVRTALVEVFGDRGYSDDYVALLHKALLKSPNPTQPEGKANGT